MADSGQFYTFLYAIKNNNFDRAKMTYNRDFINMFDKNGRSALHCSCFSNNIRVLDYLLDDGWDIESEDAIFKQRAIHYVAIYGHVEMLDILISRGCLLNERNNLGYTPLNLAIKYKKTECADILRQRIISQDKRNQLCLNNSRGNTLTSLIQVPSFTKYTKIDLLGRGSFGQVFKCLDQHTGLEFAMKEVPLNLYEASSSETCQNVAAIQNEVNLYIKLGAHARIVQYFGTTTDKYNICIFMECMPKGSIHCHLRKHGPLEHNIITRYCKEILEGLVFLHKNRIIHRDIKCSNILKDAKDNVKLCDFGVSRYLETISLDSTSNKKVGASFNGENNNGMKMVSSVCGSAFWMAPEVIRGEDYSMGADVWSLGATIVEMLIGKHPYPELNDIQALFKIGNTRKLEYKCDKPLSAELQSLLDQMLVSDPKERPQAEVLLKTNLMVECAELADRLSIL